MSRSPKRERARATAKLVMESSPSLPLRAPSYLTQNFWMDGALVRSGGICHANEDVRVQQASSRSVVHLITNVGRVWIGNAAIGSDSKKSSFPLIARLERQRPRSKLCPQNVERQRLRRDALLPCGGDQGRFQFLRNLNRHGKLPAAMLPWTSYPNAEGHPTPNAAARMSRLKSLLEASKPCPRHAFPSTSS
jgi:hypothetical protein